MDEERMREDRVERIPPQSDDAERAVLGACMQSEDALMETLEKVHPSDFYSKIHQEIYDTIFELHQKGSNVDVLTVCEELERRHALEMVGGRSYVGYLSDDVPSVRNIGDYLKIVIDKAEMRKLIATAADILKMGYSEEEDAKDILEKAEQSIFEIAKDRQSKDMVALKHVLDENMRQISERAANQAEITGVPTGFIDLDKRLSGLQKSDIIILAARPSMGKTAFALCVARNAAVKGYRVAFFSLEMGKYQLSQRIIAMESGVEATKLRTGNLETSDWQKISAVMDKLSKAEMLIDDTPGLSIMEMKNKCRRMQSERKYDKDGNPKSGLDLVVIDYLQLMSIPGKVESRQQEISSISRQLKQMARELDCPVLVLSQLSRKVEDRSDNRPMLADLRESGAIEQDADVVLFLYRDEVYHPDTETPGICEVLTSKQRNGPTGSDTVLWQNRYTRFVNMSHRQGDGSN